MTGVDQSPDNRGWFKKGQSGNPGGRPRGTGKPSRSPFDLIIERIITIERKGAPRELTIDEALQHRTYQDALAGKKAAIRLVVQWIIKREQWLAKRRQTPVAIVSQKIRHDPHNADGALVLLDIARNDPAHETDRVEEERHRLLLEPWVVAAALHRRCGAPKLTKRNCDEIRRCSRIDETVKLPEQFDE